MEERKAWRTFSRSTNLFHRFEITTMIDPEIQIANNDHHLKMPFVQQLIDELQDER